MTITEHVAPTVSVIIGIDVGLDGGVAMLGDDGQVFIYEMPTDVIVTGTKKKPKKRRVVNGHKLRRIFRDVQKNAREVYVMIERAQLRPAVRRDENGALQVNQGVASQAAFMEQYGLIRGILIGLGIPYEEVHPASWKADIFHGASDKTDARVMAANLFPNVAERFELKKNDGLAEATLIAEYARRRRQAPF